MKIHSLSYRKIALHPNKSLTINNPLLSNEKKEPKNKINLNIVKLNFDKNNNENKETNNNLEKNENQHNQVVPQKILKFNKKSLALKNKNLNEKNVKIYQKALMDELKLIVTNSNHPKNKNKNNLNNAEVQIDLPNEQNHHSLFNDYRDYQKEFFSSVYNLNINDYNNKYHKIPYSNIKSLSPNYNEGNNKLSKENKKSFNNNFHNSFISRPISNILQRKNHGELPIFLNSPVTFFKNFKSISEKERDEKNSHALLRLRDFLDIYWDKRIELITEFFSTYQINEDKYYTLKNLENFAHYVYDNINDDTNITKGIIETRIPMKEIIDKGIQYKNYSLKKLKNSKSLPKMNSEKKNNKKKSLTNYNWYNPLQSKNKNKSNIYLNKLNFRKSRSYKKVDDVTHMNGCFYNDNYINNDYQISDRENIQKKISNEKIEKYRKFLNKNYGVKVNNKFMRHYNQEEIKNYFNNRKVGTIDIPDKDNLVNNINKQSSFYKLKSTSLSIRKNQSIHTFSDKDFNELYNELQEARKSYIYDNENNIKDKTNEKENIWQRMYKDVKKNKFEKRPELILKKKKKLLEYIIFQNIQERKQLEKDLLK